MTEITRCPASPRTGAFVLSVLLVAAIAAPAPSQSGSGLSLPGGYDSVTYFSGFTSPLTALALDAQGRVFAGTLGGEIRVLLDANQDGIAEASTVFYANATNHLSSVTDILWIGPKLYVCHMGAVTTLQDLNGDDVADVVTDVLTNIPVGFHQNNGLLADGPNHLLITNGSATDLGPEANPMNAAVLRSELNGANLMVYASGIRNVFRLARHPSTGDVFGGDNEWNQHPTLALAGDEVNRIVPNGTYGFPAFFGAPPTGSTTIAPVVILPPRVAPTGLAFNPNTRISGYRDELFMTLFTQGVSAVLVRVPIWYGPVSGTPQGVAEVFASGFSNPIDVEFLPDGSMLVADFSAMTVHRIFPLRDATLTIEAPAVIGSYCPIRLRSPSHPGALVFMAASHAPQPALALGGTLVVYLDVASPVFSLSMTPGNPYFNFPLPGMLNAAGEYVAGIAIPLVPQLAGLDIWLSYAVVDANWAPLETSPEQAVKILPIF
jgi:glucose/arabinose dehydrogenase